MTPFSLPPIDLRALLPALAGLVVLAWLWAFVRARATGVPLGARLVAVDQRGWQAPARSYVSARWGLSGRPDYVVAQHGRLIPVEAKPGRRGVPRPWDVVQLGVYLLLIEDGEGQRPPYGVLAYRDGGFRIANTRRLRQEVLTTATRVRAARQDSTVIRSPQQPARCRACGYRDCCGQTR
jgi:CRISPR-associated exonuclease Cas4